jgi:hypothetical protein
VGVDDDFSRVALVNILAWKGDAGRWCEYFRGRSTTGRTAGWCIRVWSNFTRHATPNTLPCRGTQYGHCLHHRILIAYDKFMLYRVDWLCRGLPCAAAKLLEIARCGGWRGRTGRRTLRAIRDVVSIWLWSIAACANRERLVARAGTESVGTEGRSLEPMPALLMK